MGKKPKAKAKNAEKASANEAPAVIEPDNIQPEPLVEEPEEHPLTPKSSKQKLLFYGVIAFGSIAIFAAGSLLWLSRYSLVRTSIAGVGIHNTSSKEQVELSLRQQVAKYSITVKDQKGTTTHPLSEAGISVDVHATLDKAYKSKMPSNILARAEFWKDPNIPLVIKVNDTQLNTFIQVYMNQVISQPENAQIVINDAGQVTIQDGKSGQSFTVKDAPKAIEDAVSNLTPTTFELTQLPIPPAISGSDITISKEKVSTIMAQKISFSISGEQIVPKPTDIKQWIEMTAVPDKKTIDITVNSGKVLSYINKVARPYVQPPVTQIVMVDPNGEQQVLVPGRSGVDVVNKDAVAADVAKKVSETNGPINIDLPVKYASFKSINAQPHDKWIVVDTSTKRMYAYEQTTLVRTFLISAGAPRTPTPNGEYHIYSKLTIQDMRGANVDGSQYFQPNVQWVNYFTGGYAIHGNYWRPVSYFGNVNSSHGCVGIVNSDAKWIYDWAPLGTTVVIHT